MNRVEAERLLQEAEQCNPGPWGDHSRTAGYIAENIAAACGDMDSEKAYVMGLLHDIGRKFGITGLRHVTDGYRYMKELGYDDIARICLTHSFNNRNLDEYIGKKDISEEETQWLISVLQNTEYDDYDRLIQLCDALAGNGIVLDCEERMMDVRNRYGYYPQTKWDTNLRLKEYFEAKTEQNIYELLHQTTWHL